MKQQIIANGQYVSRFGAGGIFEPSIGKKSRCLLAFSFAELRLRWLLQFPCASGVQLRLTFSPVALLSAIGLCFYERRLPRNPKTRGAADAVIVVE